MLWSVAWMLKETQQHRGSFGCVIFSFTLKNGKLLGMVAQA